MTGRGAIPRLGLGLALLIAGLGEAAAACADPPAPGVSWVRCFATGRDLGGIDMRGAKLYDATLNNGNLSGTKFDRADGRRAKLIAAVARGASFDEGEFPEADFSRADLEGATFRKADLRRARFFRANLRDTDFSGARLDGADLLHADLTGALWIDGRTRCGAGSIGTCHPATSATPRAATTTAAGG